MRKIMIADDQPFARRGLKAALLDAFDDIEVIEANCLDEAVHLLAETLPLHLAIFAAPMPGVSGSAVLRDVLEHYPDTRFIVLSASRSRSDIIDALSAGLHGFVGRSQPEADVIGAVNSVLAGSTYVPSIISEGFANAHPDTAPQRNGSEHAHSTGTGIIGLTTRQLEVMALLAEGVSNKEIARVLNIVEATVKIHVSAVMRVLGARNRTEAALLVSSHLRK